jgi:hypothetical protein
MSGSPASDEAREDRECVERVLLSFLKGRAIALAPFLSAFLTTAAFREMVEEAEEGVDLVVDLEERKLGGCTMVRTITYW